MYMKQLYVLQLNTSIFQYFYVEIINKREFYLNQPMARKDFFPPIIIVLRNPSNLSRREEKHGSIIL